MMMLMMENKSTLDPKLEMRPNAATHRHRGPASGHRHDLHPNYGWRSYSRHLRVSLLTGLGSEVP